MTAIIELGTRGVPPGVAQRRTGARVTLPWLVLAALFGVAVVLRHVLAANTDVGWLITVGERVLDGQRLYVDVIETNPPIAVLAYIPGIALARLLGVPVEIVVDTLVFAGIAVSLAICARCLMRSAVLKAVDGWRLTAITFAVLAILPTQAFGQREHIAVIGLLPALAVLAMRIHRDIPPLWAVLIAGVGMALALSFKPFFAIGVLAGVVVAATYVRSWRIVLAPENVIAGVLVGLYGLAVATFYPEFFSVIGPLVRDVYLPVGIPLADLLAKPAMVIWLAASLAALLLRQPGKFDAVLALLLATSSAFALVFVLQRKGWPYHSYPAIALALIALGHVIASRSSEGRELRHSIAIAGFAAIAAASMLWFDVAFDARPLQGPVARLGPHPKILAITAEPGLGHPLVRALGGVWVSRQQGIWVAAYIDYMRKHGRLDAQQEAALEVYARRERAMLAEDVAKNPPTVVLVDNLTDNWSAWLDRHSDMAELLKDYRTTETINGIELRVRKD